MNIQNTGIKPNRKSEKLNMPIDLSNTLVIGISATALFDLSEADRLFQERAKSDLASAMDEYRRHMFDRENEPLADGTGYHLVNALLKLNQYTKPNDAPIVEVVVISRNSPETGLRVLNEIRRRKLGITRSAFTAGEPGTKYLDAFYVDLFLTTNEKDAQEVIDSKVCAAAIVKAPPQLATETDDSQVRFAFDGDAVLFDEESEIINKTEGLPAFFAAEDSAQDTPLHDGPHANLLRKLSRIQERLPTRIELSPIRIALMTARNSPAEMRVIKTLRHWGVYVDEAFFLGGLQKSRFLKAFKPHIFFDDQDSHLDPAAADVPCAKVLYPSNSPIRKIENQS